MILYFFIFLHSINEVRCQTEDVVISSLRVWNREIQRAGVVLAHFRTDWCSPCNSLETEWNRIQPGTTPQKFYGSYLSTITVDCTNRDNQGRHEICKKYDVTSWPTIISFLDGNEILRREAKDDQDWVQKKANNQFYSNLNFSEPMMSLERLIHSLSLLFLRWIFFIKKNQKSLIV